MNELFRQDNGFRIQDLTVENPTRQTESPFDPEQSITQEDWQAILAEIKRQRDQMNTNVYIRNVYIREVAEAIMLFPGRRQDLDLSRNTEGLVRWQIDWAPTGEGDQNYLLDTLLRLGQARTIFPDLTNYPRYYTAKLDSQIKAYFSQADIPPSMLAVMAMLLNRAFPNQAGSILTAQWPKISDYCQELYTFLTNQLANHETVEFESYAYKLYHMRLAYPDRLDELKVPATYWPYAEARFGSYKGFPADRLSLAVALKAVAAEKVIVDERGVQLILSTPTPEEKPELPEQRRYT